MIEEGSHHLVTQFPIIVVKKRTLDGFQSHGVKTH